MENNIIVNQDELSYEDLEIETGDEVVHDEFTDDSEHLEHYGIKGMKWGIRRFQNKDGSLTKAGLKRYSDAVGKAVAEGGKKLGEAAGKAATATKDKIAEKYAERKEEKRVEKLMSKPIRKLTEEERIERMERKMKEKELLSLEKNVRELDSTAMSRGRKFAEDMVTKVAIPSVLSAGEKQLTAFLNKKLGDALGLGEKKTTIIKDLLEGTKQITDLYDQDYNLVNKAAEAKGLLDKNFFGKNSDNNEDSDRSTVFRDFMSGKLKTSDATDGQLNKGKKGAEAADAINKLKQKDQPVVESKPDTTNSAKTNKPVSEMSDSELKKYNDRLNTEETVKKTLEKRKKEIEDAKDFVKEYENWEWAFEY